MQPSFLLVQVWHVVLVYKCGSFVVNIFLVVNIRLWLKVLLVLFIVFRYKVNLFLK